MDSWSQTPDFVVAASTGPYTRPDRCSQHRTHFNCRGAHEYGSGARTVPREIAITSAHGQDTLCDSPTGFLGRHTSRAKAFNVLSWKGICSRGRNKRWLTPSVWSMSLTAFCSIDAARYDLSTKWEVSAKEPQRRHCVVRKTKKRKPRGIISATNTHGKLCES